MIPAILCAGISFVAFLFSVKAKASWWQPAFYVFLPACFICVGLVMIQMHREISRLRRRIGRLEMKTGTYNGRAQESVSSHGSGSSED